MNHRLDRGEAPQTLTVSQLNRQVRSLLESHFDFIWVTGEISNLARPSSGHWYFTLKDGDAQVRCAMFRNRNQRLRFVPDQGDEVRLRARVSLYEGRGEFQLIVEHLEPAGVGALQVAFETLKAALLEEGLFDAERKRPLPETVTRLGVITSATGAAIHDILTVLQRRAPAIEVYILPVAVQGEGSALQIAEAIRRANRWQTAGKVALDALIVGRGGGSLEDLWAFNEEVVARAIADSDLPVVSAVGHEVDFTIADFVADQRAPTPSAAAEMLSPDQAEQRLELTGRTRALLAAMRRHLDGPASTLGHLRRRLRHPGDRLREQAQRVDDIEQRLLRAQRHRLRQETARLQALSTRLDAGTPRARLRRMQEDNRRVRAQLRKAMLSRLERSQRQLDHLGQLLQSVSPEGVLQRGYAILRDQDGRVIRDAGSVQAGDALEVKVARGRLGVTVERVDPD